MMLGTSAAIATIVITALTAVWITVDSCEVTAHQKSSYITARNEQFFNVSGCTSQQTTATSHEVHVIKLLSGGPNSGRHGPEVQLKIKQNHNTADNHVHPVIFILSSQEPINWKIHSELPRSVRHLLVVPRESHVKNARVSMKISKSDSIPHSTQELREWVQRKYRAITSFMEVDHANVIFPTVGIDPNDSRSCVIGNYSIKHGAGYVQSVPTWSCPDLSHTARRRDVHIIELHNVNLRKRVESSKDDVSLHIRTQSGRNLRRRLVLVLKSHQPVRWHLFSKHMRGTIQIISNGEVDTNNIHGGKIQALAEDLPQTRQKLISMVKSRFGPALTYTEVRQANKFILHMDGKGNQTKNHRSKSEAGESRKTDSKSRKSNTKISWHRQPVQKIKDRLNEALTVQCHDQGMLVLLRKSFLQKFGVKAEQLSLADTECGAAENRTHYVLHTRLNECNTKQEQEPNSVSFVNEVVLRGLIDKKAPHHSNPASDHQRNISGTQNKTGGSEIGTNDRIHTDGKGFSATDSVAVDVACKYSTGSIEKFNRRSSEQFPQQSAHQRSHTGAENLNFELQFYSDENYSSVMTQKPFRFLERTDVYVQATLVNTLPHLRPVIHGCSLASSERMADKHVHPLIDNGCTIEKSVKWPSGYTLKPGKEYPSKPRFSFRLHRFLNNGREEGENEMYLQCNLTSCNADPTHSIPGIKKCVDQQRYCIMMNMKEEEDSMVNNGFTRKQFFRTLGPILMISKQSDGANQHIIDPPNPDGTVDDGYERGCNNKECNGKGSTDSSTHQVNPIQPGCSTVVEGLDSAAVIGIAFGAFFIGVLLTAVLWYIHTHTGPIRRKPKLGQRSAESSGQSTPSSSAPIST